MTQPHYIYCQECGTVVAEVRGQLLILRLHHHGEVHTTVVDLVDALEMCAENSIDSALTTNYTIVDHK